MAAEVPPPEIDDATRSRFTSLIFVAVALGSTSLYAAFTAAPIAVTEIGRSRAWSGVPGAASVMGVAVGATLLSKRMARRGRPSGLRMGWLFGVAGALAAAVAVGAGSFLGLVAAMALIGVGHASNQLSRFAAADAYPLEKRAAVLGWIVWASTIGAALGPTLLDPGENAADALGFSRPTGGFLIAVVFYVASLGCALMLRPAPATLEEQDSLDHPTSVGLRSMIGLQHVQTSLVMLLVSQVPMIMIMTMTPLHIREHGHGLEVVGLVMSSHLVGMFAFAPWIGKLVGRIESVRAGAIGMALLLVAALGAAASPPEHSHLIGIFLFLLGLGWCFGFVAGSALLLGGLAYAERVRLQGSVDTLVWGFSAVASLGSGILLATFSYSVLSLIGAVGIAVLMLYLAARRTPAGPSTATP